ncbi:phage tail length tape measure family protein [Sinorhizobium meliloti]|uniref:phage tail length tape measure family protein n=1 Tax=Rhizobium meliloti TaxID=382 RepID=UPI000FDB73F7|nr:phage tail length tape measure family protein [Sinorhizobium meliloti]MDW9625704.1 phage tail tape-measure protein [Sinorhizobium meliloti]MDW9816734.1 phage tail tape-measure protein [Sinorhizobium meliloti]MDW9839220.1 phage tail tape-measure protein [Sinorhizobium meliloti]MDW9996512.1 phage tail tape-measure protein [Sinorhizobium meliloti]RVM11576.1 phage tail tape-measure protein [Sinorhizobium meliloti]
MADVATLGLQVESGSVEKGTQALNQLTGAAARAEAAANGLSGAHRGATGAAAAAAKAYATEGAAAASASKQIEMMNRAANQNRASSRGNLGNIAAQFQDIAVSAQMGMGPLQIALQQGTQLAAVLSTMEKPVQGLGAALLSVLSPVSLLTIGLIALAAAGLQMVDWTKLAQSALLGLADVLETTAPYAVAAATALALIYAPAIIGGIISLIALLGRLVVQLGILAGAFILANPAVAFVAGITAAVGAANIFRDELAKIFGRDIVADAKNAVNFIIAAFVGGFNGIKSAWSLLPAALGDVIYSTAQLVLKGTELMVNKVISMISDFIGGTYDALSGLAGKVGLDIGTFGGIDPVDFGKITNPYKDKALEAASGIAQAMKEAQGTDFVGEGLRVIGEYASTAAGKIKDLAKGLADVDEKSKKRTGGKSEQEKYADIVAGAERQIAALEAERDAIGLTEQAAAALRYETQLLNEAQQRGISLTDAQKSELSLLAQVMASIEEETRQMGIALDFAKEVTGGFFDDFFAGIERGKSVWESFGDAALGVLDRIADKLLNDVLDAVFQVSGAGGGVGGGGLLGWLFTGGSKVDPWAGLRGYANGTSSARPGVAWVGEKGPELVRFKGGEEVIPNHRLQRPVNGNLAPSAGQPGQNGPREIILRVIAEEGPMFRPVIRSESRGVSVETIKQYDAAKANIYQNGEDR